MRERLKPHPASTTAPTMAPAPPAVSGTGLMMPINGPWRPGGLSATVLGLAMLLRPQTYPRIITSALLPAVPLFRSAKTMSPSEDELTSARVFRRHRVYVKPNRVNLVIRHQSRIRPGHYRAEESAIGPNSVPQRLSKIRFSPAADAGGREIRAQH